jgi:acyl-CoA synthetase (AMP-forming)/AMP-acid ligase II
MPLTDFVLKDYKKFGDRPALVNGLTGESLTFPQTRDAIWRVASGLSRHGVRQNDVVMIVSENSVEYVVTFHAILSLGATATMVNPIYPSNDIVNQAKHSRSKFVITSSRCLSKALDVQNALPDQIKKMFAFFADDTDCVPYSVLLADDGSMFPKDVDIDPKSHVALLPYSIGTTGMPKGVMLSHYNEVANCCQADLKCLFENRDGVVQLAVLPFYHIFAVITTFVNSLAWGQTSVVVPGFDPRVFLEVVPKFKVDSMSAVPPIIMFLNKHPMAAKADLSSLRRVVSGAAPLGPEMVQEFHEKHPQCSVGQGYGMTETAPVITCNPINSCVAKPAAAGIPVANTEVKLVDTSTGEECESGEHGEVCCRGPQMMLGYLNNPKATAEMIDNEGWLHTGDIGYLDTDNHLYISDRLKELIKYKGLQVPPAELEALLCTHPAVSDAGVIGIPDIDAGELPRAYVSLKQGATASPNEIQSFVNNHVVAYKRLRGGVEIVSEIPRSAAGKVLRKQLKEIAKSPNVDPNTFSPLMME